jgi:TonB-dependent receptor
MKKMVSALSLLLLVVVPGMLLGQGALRGVVTDSLTKSPMIGVNVFLVGTGLGSATDVEGQYKIQGVPLGKHTLRVSSIGYAPREVQVTIASSAPVQLNFDLSPTVIQGQEVVITAQRRGQIAAMNQQLTSNTMVNVVSEEKIQQLPDANAAEAIGRLPGVSLLRAGGEANKVVMRGLSDKFSVITVDGVRMAPTDKDSRGVDLSTISQGSLSGIELFKALTADKDADAIAGSINLVTRKAPSERLVRLEPKGGYNALDKSADQYNLSGRYGERFFNDLLGVQISGGTEKVIRSNEFSQRNYDFTRIGSPPGTDYEISEFRVRYTNEIRKRNNGSLLLDFDTPDRGSVRFNTIFDQTSRNSLQSYRTYAPNGEVQYQYEDRDTKITTLTSSLHGENYLLGLKANWGFSFSESKRDVPYDYMMNFRESTGMNNVPQSFWKGPVEEWIPYARNNFAGTGLYLADDMHENNYDKEISARLDLERQYSIADFVIGEIKAGGKFRAKSRNMNDYLSSARYYLWRPPLYTKLPDGKIVPKDPQSYLKMDGDRILFTTFLEPNPPRRSVYGTFDLFPLINRSTLELFRQFNINGYHDQSGTTQEYFENFQYRADAYNITERVYAGYLMNTFNFGQMFTLIAGVRVEQDDNEYSSKYSPYPLAGAPFGQGLLLDTTAYHKETMVLPNLQAIVKAFDFLNIRLAAYEALARPDFNQRLLKFIATSSGGNTLDIGNPELANAVAWNLEVQSQLFGNNIGLFSVSAFYKDIKNMYHMVNEVQLTGQKDLDSLGVPWKSPWGNSGTFTFTWPYNSKSPTRVWGFEVEHQADLKFLPGLLKNITLGYNFTLVRSETHITSSKLVNYRDSTFFLNRWVYVTKTKTQLIEKKQKLEDQPEFFGNLSLGYDIAGFSFRISAFHQGSYFTSFSADQRTDRIQDSYTKLDITLGQKLTDRISLLLNLNNITNSQEAVSYNNSILNGVYPYQDSKYGMTADLGVRVNF